MNKTLQAHLFTATLALVGCAVGETIDETGVTTSFGDASVSAGGAGATAPATGGGVSTGGLPATGGLPTATGGLGGAGGMATTGGSGGNQCEPGMKRCGGICTPPAPGVGCNMTDCEPCPGTNPTGGAIVCIDEACSIECDDGFVLAAGACEPEAGSNGGTTSTGGTSSTGGTATGGSTSTGGTTTGGTSSTGGTTGGCNANQCPDCGPVLGPSCCTSSGSCGCPTIPYVTATCG